MINLIFEGSGCLGTLDDLRCGRLYQPDFRWLDANYFHPAEENNWLELLTQLLAVRTAGLLPPRSPRPRVALPGESAASAYSSPPCCGLRSAS
jgi:hypothetical protein